jgi:hypothetical protein
MSALPPKTDINSRSLKCNLFSAQQVISILPIITGLNTTDDSVHMNGIRAKMAGAK